MNETLGKICIKSWCCDSKTILEDVKKDSKDLNKTKTKLQGMGTQNPMLTGALQDEHNDRLFLVKATHEDYEGQKDSQIERFQRLLTFS